MEQHERLKTIPVSWSHLTGKQKVMGLSPNGITVNFLRCFMVSGPNSHLRIFTTKVVSSVIQFKNNIKEMQLLF